MKRFLIFLIFFTGNAQQKLIDEIVAIIYTGEKQVVIAHSDIRPGLDGMPRSIRQIILEHLMIIDGEKLITVTEEDIDRFISHLQKENNLTQDAVKSLFRELGCTVEEGRELLRKRQIIDGILGYRVREDKNLNVTRQDALDYYAAHPESKEATFTLAQTFVPQEKMSKNELLRLKKLGKLGDTLSWDAPFTLKQSELAADRQFIINEPVGAIVEFEEVDGGFDITRLVSKTSAQTVPVEEYFDEIMNYLRQERYRECLENYYSMLLSKYTIRFTHPEDKKLVFEPA